MDRALEIGRLHLLAFEARIDGSRHWAQSPRRLFCRRRVKTRGCKAVTAGDGWNMSLIRLVAILTCNDRQASLAAAVKMHLVSMPCNRGGSEGRAPLRSALSRPGTQTEVKTSEPNREKSHA